MVKRKSQPTHDDMVKKCVEHLISNGYTKMCADLAGYDQPPLRRWEGQQTGHIPDIDATHPQREHRILLEVETEDTITIDHTKEQWKLFAATCDQNKWEFIVVIPAGHKKEAETTLREIGKKLRFGSCSRTTTTPEVPAAG